MPQAAPSWLLTMREINGTLESSGSADNPVILSWGEEIAERFPEMASYCAGYKHDAIPWCGLTVAYCMAHNGIKPIFGATDTDKFLWAYAWKQFGTGVERPQLGDVLVFHRHVTLYEGEQGDYYLCRGGNQADSVKVSQFLKSGCQAIRRPPTPELAGLPSHPAVLVSSSARRFAAITATVFGGGEDPNSSAYDQHTIDDDELGVALPARFKGSRPKVRVYMGNRSVECDIVDVGPWNINDPYWETGTRPQAESGRDRSGRATNLAGIDLTPGAARAIGLHGKGKVDWEFAGPPGLAPAPPVSEFRPVLTAVSRRLERLEEILAILRSAGLIPGQPGPLPAPPGPAVPAPTPPQPPASDLSALVQQVVQLLKIIAPGQPAGTAASTQESDELRKVLEIIQTIAGIKAGGALPLGQVNGALGETIGKLLNGKKSAIGIIGALATTLLSQVPAASGLGQVLALLTPTGGLSQFTLPTFIAIAAWGALGKLEKWAQGTAPPPGTT
jgi:uncharacterized protein (TIGR02594 family)